MRADHERLKDDIKDGVIPATVTPLTPEYDVATEDLRRHIESLSGVDGIVGLMANAHSGESSMTPTEVKAEVVETHLEASGDTPVFSGVSGESTALAIEEARALEAAGASALMPVPIGVESNGDPRILRDHYGGIADAVDIPLIAFQFGNYGAITQPIAAYVQLCEMDEVIALKDATFDPVRYEKTVRALAHLRDEFTLLSGNDTFLFHSYHLGAESALISYANLIPERHVEKVRATNRGDLDRALELRAEMLDLTNFLFKEPTGRYRQRTKAALQMQGVFEHDTVRPPQQPLDPEEKDELRAILQDLDAL